MTKVKQTKENIRSNKRVRKPKYIHPSKSYKEIKYPRFTYSEKVSKEG